MYLIPFANSLKYTHTLRNLLIFRFYVAILVSAKSAISPDFKRRLVLMNEQTVGAILENYDVAMLAGHNVMHYSDSLKEEYLHKLFESHSKVFQNSHFDFSSIIWARFSSKLMKSQSQKEREQTCIISFCVVIA